MLSTAIFSAQAQWAFLPPDLGMDTDGLADPGTVCFCHFSPVLSHVYSEFPLAGRVQWQSAPPDSCPEVPERCYLRTRGGPPKEVSRCFL